MLNAVWRRWISRSVFPPGPGSTTSRRRGRRQPVALFRPWMERLEDRTLMATVSWTGAGGNSNWNTPANWSTNAVPGASDDVTINLTGASVVHSNAVVDTIQSLSLSNPLLISGGSIQISGTVSGSGILTVGPGTLKGATIQAGATIRTAASSGTLDGLTINGLLDMTQVGSSVFVNNSLTLNGTALLGAANGSTYGQLAFQGASSTLSGTGHVIMGGSFSNAVWSVLPNGAGLTVGPGILIDGAQGYIGGDPFSASGTTFLNQGTIAANAASGTGEFRLVGTGWTNAGRITATNGNDLVVGGTSTTAAPAWTNTGTIGIGGGGTLTLTGTGQLPPGGSMWVNLGTIEEAASTVNFGNNDGSTLTAAALGRVVRILGPNDGTLNIRAAFNNVSNITLDGTKSFSQGNVLPGTWHLSSGGNILGGSVNTANGAALAGGGSGGALTGVTINGVLDLTPNYTTIYVYNGLTLNGTALIGASDGSTYSALYFNSPGSQTFTTTTSGTVLFGNSSGNLVYVVPNDSSLTVAPGILIHGERGYVGGYIYGTNVSFLNQGTIAADGLSPSSSITVNATRWTNAGLIQASNGADLLIQGTSTTAGPGWTNTGTIAISGGGTLTLGGTGPLPTSGPAQGSNFLNQGVIQETGSTVLLGYYYDNTVFTLASLGNFKRLGGPADGTTFIQGTLANTTGVILDGNLSNTSGNSLPGTWTLKDGGTIQGGAVTTQNNAVLAGDGLGRLTNGVTINGTFDLSNKYADIRVTGGLTLNGTIKLGSPTASNYALLAFDGTSQITSSSSGRIILGSSAANSVAAGPTSGSSLTIASTINSNILIEGQSGYIGYSPYVGGSTQSFLNHGTISVNTLGGNGLFTLGGAGWTNAGLIQALNGNDLLLEGTSTAAGPAWTNASTGTIAISGGGSLTLTGTGALPTSGPSAGSNWLNQGRIQESGSTVNFGYQYDSSVFTVAAIGNLTRVAGPSDGRLNIVGTLANAPGVTFNGSVGSSSPGTLPGSWVLMGGTIQGGDVNILAPAVLIGGTTTSYLTNGVTLHGVLDLRQFTSQVNVTGGLTLDGTVYLGNDSGSTYGNLAFTGGTQTLDGPVSGGNVVLGKSGANSLAAGPQSGSSLTIGSHIRVSGHSGYIGYSPYVGGATISFLNLGSIGADAATGGGIIYLGGTRWTNNGTIYAYNGNKVVLEGTSTTAGPAWTNNGTVSAIDSTIVLTGTGALPTSGPAQGSNWLNLGTVDERNSTVILGNNDGSVFKVAALGQLNRTSSPTDGTYMLQGTLDNAAGITLDGSTSFSTGSNLPGSMLMSYGGTILGGTVTTVNGAALVSTSSNSRLAGGVTINGTVGEVSLDLATYTTTVYVTGGLTINGIIKIGATNGSTYGILAFNGGSQTLTTTSSGHIIFGDHYANSLAAGPTSGSALTIASTINSNILIDGQRGYIGDSPYVGGSNVSFLNHGTISANGETGNGIITLQGQNWTNAGAIVATNGNSLSLAGTSTTAAPAWTNAAGGTIGISGGGNLTLTGSGALPTSGAATGSHWLNQGIIRETGSIINIGNYSQTGTVAVSALGTISRLAGPTDGIIYIYGTLVNDVGLTLNGAISTTTAGAQPGSWRLSTGGAIKGGTVTTQNGAALVSVGSTNELIGGVTINGTAGQVALELTSSTTLNVTGGLTVNGTVLVGHADNGNWGRLMFVGGTAQTLATSTGATVIFGESTINSLSLNNQGGSLTIGPGVLVRGDNGYVGFDPNFGGSGTFLNQGTIFADVAGGRIQVQNISNFSAGTLTGGAWKAANGGTLRLMSSAITTIAANVALDGSTSRIVRDTSNNNALSGLATIAATGSLTLMHLGDQDPASLTTTVSVDNNGTLTIDPLSRLAVTGNYTQSSTGVLNVQIGGAPAGGSTYVSATANVTLGGTLNISYINNFSPPDGSIYTLATGNVVSGTFATLTGLTSPSGAIFSAVYGAQAMSIALSTTASRLLIAPPIGTITAGTPFNVNVQVLDASSNLVRNYTGNVTIAIGTNPSGGTLSGTLTVAASNGLASFTNLSINNAGVGYTLTANATGLTGATSNGFNVQAAPATTTITWTGAVNTDWNTAGNWNLGRLPGVGDDVVINAGTSVVHSNAASDAVQSITTTKPLTISAGSLGVLSTISSTSTLIISGGTLTTATIAAGTTLRSSGGTIDAVTINGTLDMATSSTTLLVTNGLTLNGTIQIGNASGSTFGRLRFVSATQTLATASTGNIIFGASTANQVGPEVAGGILTIAPGILIHGRSGFVGSQATIVSFVNQGAISADDSSGTGTITVGGAAGNSWLNRGTIQALNGNDLILVGESSSAGPGWTNAPTGLISLSGAGIIALQGSGTLPTSGPATGSNWLNQGTIALTGGTLNLGNPTGTFTAAALGSISRLGGPNDGTIRIVGTLNNSGNLTLDGSISITTAGAQPGSFDLAGGTILGGTFTTQNNAALNGGSGGTLSNGVRLVGVLDNTQTNTAQINVSGGLTLDGTVLLGNAQGSVSGALNFFISGPQTLSTTSTGTILFGASANNSVFTSMTANNALTIGPGILIHGRNGYVTETSAHGTSSTDVAFVNQGTIAADYAGGGGTIFIFGSNWINQGTIQASNGNTVVLNGPSTTAAPAWTNAAVGLISASGGATITLNGAGPVPTSGPSTGSVWLNQGSIRISQSTLNLGAFGGTGVITDAAIGSIQRLNGPADGVIQFYGGTLDNTAGLNLDGNRSITGGGAQPGSWLLIGGAIQGGTVTTVNGAALVGGQSGTGTLANGVTINGVLDLSRFNTSVNVTGGLILNGTAKLGSPNGSTSSQLRFNGGAQFLGSTFGGNVIFGGSGSNVLGVISNGASLTIGANILVNGQNGYIGYDPYVGGTVSFFNNGTISADNINGGAGTGTLRLGGTGWSNRGLIQAINGNTVILGGTSTTAGPAWTNLPFNLPFAAGTLAAINGGILTLTGTGTLPTSGPATGSNWLNLGQIKVNRGTLQFGYNDNSKFTVAALGAIHRVDGPGDGTIFIMGTLDNAAGIRLDGSEANSSGSTLPGSWILSYGGVIQGGTVDTIAGAALQSQNSGGLAGGVTVNGTLDFSRFYTTVYVTGGLTLNGKAFLGAENGGTYAAVVFNSIGNQTLGGTAEIILGYNGNNGLFTGQNNSSFTIAPTVLVHGHYGYIGGNYYSSNSSFRNEGTILIDRPQGGGVFNLRGNAFTNAGLIEATSGNTIALLGTSTTAAPAWTNLVAGTLFAESGGVLTLTGTGPLPTSGPSAGSHWLNQGLIKESASSVYLGDSSDTFTLATLGTIKRLGGPNDGTIAIRGTLNNASDLVLDGNVNISAGNVMPGSWQLYSGGKILGGSVTTQNGAALVANSTGYLAGGVTITSNSTLDQSQFYNTIYVTGGLTLNGTIKLGSPTGSNYSLLNFDGGSQTLTSTSSGLIVLGTSTANSVAAGPTANSSLTIGSNILIEGFAGRIGYSPYLGGSSISFLNQGTIRATGAAGGGGTIYFDGLRWTNAGSIEATAGYNLLLQGTSTTAGPAWTNTGTIAIAGGGTLTLSGSGTLPTSGPATGSHFLNQGLIRETGSVVQVGYYSDATVFTVPALGNLVRQAGPADGTLIIASATLANAGGVTLDGAVNATGVGNVLPGSWILDYTTIQGGTITTTNGAALFGRYGPIELNAVTINGVLDLTTYYTTVRVTGGLVLNGTLKIGSTTGYYSYLEFTGGGSQTLSTTTGGTVIFGSSYYNSLAAGPTNNSSLTIGPGIVVRGQQGNIGYSPYVGGTGISFLNQGTIASDMGGELRVTSISNYAGGTLTGGAWRADANSILRLYDAPITTNAAALIVGPQGRIYSNTATADALGALTTIVAGASLQLIGNATFASTGNLTNAGSLIVDQKASLKINGNYTQAATGSLTLSIGGPPYDGLFLPVAVITGTADLNGTFTENLVNGFIPSMGQMYRVITFGARVGDFATKNLSYGNNRAFLPAYAANALDLTWRSAATHLGFIQQPTNTVAGQPVTPAVTVAALDQNNQVVTTDYTETVTVTPSIPPPTPVPSGAVSWFRGDNNANDVFGTNNGTLQGGATFAPGMVGQAFSFDGVDDYVSAPSSPSLNFGTGDFSVEYWVNFNDLTNAIHGLISKDSYTGGGSYAGWLMNIDDAAGGIGILTRDTSSGLKTNARIATSNFSVGQWYHLAATRNQNVLRFYVNGVLRATTAEASPTNVTTSAELTIGVLNPIHTQYFNGRIDDVTIYNRGLSAAEIQQIFNAGSAGKVVPSALLPSGAVSWYTAEGNAGDRVDGNNGTLVGGLTFAPGKVGQAFNFDGVDDSVDLGTWFNLQSFSIEMWVKPGATQVTYANIIDNNHTGSRSWELQQNGDNLNQYGFGGQDGTGPVALFNLTAGVWQHLAVTRDASSRVSRIYVNGSLVGTQTGTGDFPYDGSQFLRLGRWGGGGRNWNGQMDEVTIFNRALSPSEIQSIVAAGSAGKTTSPASYTATLVNGVASFSNISLTKAGTYTLSATDTSPVTYNLANDWSDVVNPNGVWTYEEKPGQAITSHLDNWFPGVPAWAHTVSGTPGHIPAFWKAAGVVTMHNNDDANSFDGLAPFPAAIAWTAPKAGTITISGYSYETAANLGRFEDWGLYKNGTLLTGGVLGPTYDSQANAFQFAAGSGGTAALTLAVNAGDVIEYQLQRHTGTVYGTSVAIEMNVSLVPTGAGGALPHLALSPATSNSFQILAAPANSMSATGIPATVTAGVTQNTTVTLYDVFGNVATGYTGTVAFTSTDPQAALPANYAFTAADQGMHVFPVTLKTVGTRSVTTADTVNAALSATQGNISVQSAPLASFTVSGFPASTTAGVSGSITVKAQDAFGNTVTGYTGTITFTSSDPLAALPANYTFTAGDAGVHTFSGVTLKTAGTQSITAKDTVNAAVTGSQTGIVVSAAAASTLAVSGFPSPQTAGVSGSITVRAVDPFGNIATSFTGSVQLASSDLQAVLPAAYAYTGADLGSHTFAGVTLKTAGIQSITAGGAGLTGSQTGINVLAAAASSIVVSGFPSPASQDVAANFTVTARDAFNNPAAGYTGTIHFTSSDPLANLPADYTFVAADAGAHTFSATFRTSGTQALTGTDTVTSSLTGTQANIQVVSSILSALSVSGYPSPVTAGVAGSITVRAQDSAGGTVAGYTGTIHFTSSDGQAVLPADYTFTAADQGVHTFTGVMLKTAGTQSIAATDAIAAVSGSQSGIVVSAAAASTLGVGGFPSPQTAGVAGSVTVTALDSFGNTATGFTGTIQFSSTDGQAVLPAAYSFTGADQGSHLFTGVVLKTAGTRSITAAGAGLSGSQTGINVVAAAASAFVVAGFPSPQTAGVAGSVTVTAKDPFGNTATGFTGSVQLTSSDAQAVLPAAYSYAAADQGAHVFTGVVLKTAGIQSITASGAGLTGSQTGINVVAAAASSIVLAGFPSPIPAGDPGSFTVTARDAFNNIAIAYTGTIHFSSTDAQAVLPADYTFVAADAGVHSFSATLRTPGTQSLTGTDTGTPALTSTQGSIQVTQVPTQMVFTQQPVNTTAGQVFGVQVSLLDKHNKVVLIDSTTQVTVGIATGSGSFLAGSTLTVTAVNGVATFSNLAIGLAGSYTLSAASTGLPTAVSQSFTVAPGAATQLILGGFPSPLSLGTVTAGEVGSFSVTAFDAYGNVATGFSGVLHFTSTDPQASLPPDSTLTFGSGGFTAILKTVGTRSLTATELGTSGLSGTQSPITVNPAAASHLVFAHQPTNAVAGVVLTPDIIVKLFDPFGNLDTGNSSNVTLAVGANPGGSTLSGTLTVAASGGIATFSDISLNKSGIGYTLTAASGSLAGATSTTFDITPAAANHLGFFQQPTTTAAGQSISPAVTVQLLDPFGNVDTNSNASVTVALGANPGGSALSGTLTVAANAGIATFGDLSLNKVGAGYTLNAFSPVVTSATSVAFNITPAAANHLAFAQQSSDSVAGASIAPAVTVQLLDQFDNLDTNNGSSVTLALAANPGGGTLSGTLAVSASGGIATFGNLSLDKVGNGYTLAASSGALAGATSTTFTITPAPANHLVFVQQPTDAVAGVSIAPAITVQLLDAFDNLATSSSANVTLALAANPGGSTLSGTVTVAAVGGIATFGDLSLNKAGSGYTLSASDGGLIGATSAAFNITAAAPAALVIGNLNTTPGAAGPQSFSVTALDAFGNTATSFAGSVSFSSSDPAAVLPATYQFTGADQGTHSFSVTFNTLGAQSLTATSQGFAAEQNVTVVPGAVASLVVSGFPSPSTPGIFSPFTVTLKDTLGNVATNSTDTVTFSSSDPQALSIAPYTFTAADQGAHTFSFAFATPGTQSLTAAVQGTSVQGTLGNLAVVDPVITASGNKTVPIGATYTLTFAATNLGTDSILNWVINWGDKSAETLPGTAASAQHIYLTNDPNGFYITVSALDARSVKITAPALVILTLDDNALDGDVQAAAPGETVTVSSAGVQGSVSAVVTNSGGGIIVPSTVVYTTNPTDAPIPGLVWTDFSITNADEGTVATVTFTYHGDVTNPGLFFFDPVSHSWVQVKGKIIGPTTDPNDPTLHSFTVVFDKNSTPKIMDLHGTIFTVSVSTAPVQASTTVSPLTVSLLQGDAGSQAAFVTNSQLSLSLTPLQQSQLSASKSGLTGEGLSHNGGTEEEPTEATDEFTDLLKLINEMFGEKPPVPAEQQSPPPAENGKSPENAAPPPAPSNGPGQPEALLDLLDSYFADVVPVAPLQQPAAQPVSYIDLVDEPDALPPRDDHRRAAALAAFGLAYVRMSWREPQEAEGKKKAARRVSW